MVAMECWSNIMSQKMNPLWIRQYVYFPSQRTEHSYADFTLSCFEAASFGISTFFALRKAIISLDLFFCGALPSTRHTSLPCCRHLRLHHLLETKICSRQLSLPWVRTQMNGPPSFDGPGPPFRVKSGRFCLYSSQVTSTSLLPVGIFWFGWEGKEGHEETRARAPRRSSNEVT